MKKKYNTNTESRGDRNRDSRRKCGWRQTLRQKERDAEVGQTSAVT